MPRLEEKFASVGLMTVNEGEQSGWKTAFYFSKDEEPNPIPWVEEYAEFFGKGTFRNLIYFAAYVFHKEDRYFVLTYGKSHFYVRPLCDHDFGIEMAKRIADENDIKQTASKKFAGKKKKEIKSYTSNTPLNIESGESVDYLRAAIELGTRESFGQSGKFGSSVLLNAPITKTDIGALLDKIVALLGKEPRFKLPRTTVIADEEQVNAYDQGLVTAITGDGDTTEFTHSGHDIIGVDFVFSGNERYTLSCRGHKQKALGDAELDITLLREYIASEDIKPDEVLDIRVRIDNEGQKSYWKPLREALDFIVAGENVMLSQGRWVRFNEDYIDQLNEYLDAIPVEATEPEFRIISMEEGDFNTSEAAKGLGYVVADKDFSKIKTKMSTPIEAWDLHKGATVYAVKFGTAQNLGYVCDQANNVLEIIRTNSNLKKLNQEFKTYCLWLGFKLKKLPTGISASGSIILKQKIEAWARRCRDLGIEPRLKLSLRQ
ncbi:DUF6119 family protein [Phytohabitans sp. LJ34]|uniref:DUF6119 family protein n=1 Tax=Phytohabitans sp. LJ34 TaxID=3452217 RepID=UPI003F89CFA4